MKHSARLIKSSLAVLLVSVVTLAAACTPKVTPTTTTPPTNAAAPSITITAPANGSTAQAGPIQVTVSVKNFTLVNKLGEANVTGEGHIHYFLDVTPPTAAGQKAVTAAGTYAASASTQNVWQNVTAGSHTFYAELINNDHTPLVPPVVTQVTVTVTAPTAAAVPTLTITAPKDGATVPAGNVTVSVSTTNFSLVNKLSQANALGEGHIHYFLDVTPPTEPGKAAVTAAGTYAADASSSHVWANVPAGTHTFYAELINNDHTPLVPPVVQKVTVTVAAASPAASPAANAPTITITVPANGSTVAPGSVAVTVSTANIALTPIGQPNATGQGHIHFFLDVTPPTEPGKAAVTAPGTYAAQPGTSYTWPNVTAGSHTFYAELVNNDHTPLVPPVVTQVTVTVGTAAPTGGLGY